MSAPITSPCFPRPRFELGHSSRVPQDVKRKQEMEGQEKRAATRHEAAAWQEVATGNRGSSRAGSKSSSKVRGDREMRARTVRHEATAGHETRMNLMAWEMRDCAWAKLWNTRRWQQTVGVRTREIHGRRETSDELRRIHWRKRWRTARAMSNRTSTRSEQVRRSRRRTKNEREHANRSGFGRTEWWQRVTRRWKAGALLACHLPLHDALPVPCRRLPAKGPGTLVAYWVRLPPVRDHVKRH